ncbi:MAG TPA: SpoIIE family protein phosphatase [Candidatus Acidoferrum sp.]|nr:SpoIIE family protein phosphatase [Candidatus Acidoferrum sp.]
MSDTAEKHSIIDSAATQCILIAEDQPDVSEALRLLLKGAGFKTEWANSPARVLQIVEQRSFDAVLLDLNYARDTTSGEEGLDLITRLRAIDPILPLVVMTAWSTVDLAVQAMRLGANDFIQKPWENARLLALLRKQISLAADGRRESDRLRLERHDAEEAREIQRSLLPTELPQIPGVEISADWLPARGVSGDYFDVLKFSDTRVGFCIADVAGKGMAAALLMSNLQATVRAFATPDRAPRELCEKVNGILCKNQVPGRFITFFYGVLDARGKSLAYCNAGHNAPILHRRDGSFMRLEDGGPVLAEFPGQAYAQGAAPVAAGDRLLLFTDGVSEARSADGDEFGEERLLKVLAAHRGLGALELRRKLLQDVHEFSERPLHDDATLLVLASL